MSEKKEFSHLHRLLPLICLIIILSAGLNNLAAVEYNLDPAADSDYQAAVALYNQEQFSPAAMAFTKLVTDYPLDARITIFKLMQAKALYYAGNLAESKIALNRLIKTHPRSSFIPTANYFLGRIYYRQELYDSAALALIKAVEESGSQRQKELFLTNLKALAEGKLSAEKAHQLMNQAEDEELSKELALIAIEKFYIDHNFERADRLYKDFILLYPESASDKRLNALRQKIELFSSQKAILALFAPISGELARFGRMMSNAFELAVESYLENPTLELERRTFDTFGNSIVSAIDAKKISGQPVSAIIGPLSSAEAVGIAAYADIANIPLICPTASEKGLTSISDMLFQLSPTPERMGEAMADFVTDQFGLDSVAVLAPLDNYGKQVSDGFVRRMSEKGGTVFFQKFYPRGSRDFRRFMLDLKDELLPDTFVAEIFLNADGDTMEVEEIPLNVPALFLPAYTSELKLLLPQLRFYKINTILLGTDSYGEDEIVEMRESKDNPIFFASKSLFLPEDTAWLKFNYLYQTKFEEAPDRVAAITYDAANLVLDCVREGLYTSEDIWRCIKAKGVYEGASGIIDFNAQRENVRVPIYLTHRRGNYKSGMMQDILEKYNKLKAIIGEFNSAVIAYSGGLDSAFLLYAAVDTLGVDKVTAMTADSPSYPRSEMEEAKKFAQSLGLGENHKIVQTCEMDNPNYAANPVDRCFFCKKELFTRLTDFAVFESCEVVLDGYNADDVGDFRPGRKAADKFSVRSPLFEAGLGKSEIRQLAQHFGLSIWNKPQMACLSSRIPYGSPVTKEKLEQIEQAEKYLHELGFNQLRVRHHDKIARIELPLEDIKRVYNDNLHDKITEKFRSLGFVWVTLDLAGFRSGSMNEILKESQKDV